MKKVILAWLAAGIFFLTPLPGREIEKIVTTALEMERRGDIQESIKEFTRVLVILQNRLDLVTRNLALCYDIQGFGNYHRIDTFTLQEGQPLLLYLEIEGFGVEEDGNKYWIHLSEDMVIKDNQGNVLIQRDDFMTYRKFFRVPVVPFHLENRVTAIPPGEYTYHLTIHDHVKSVSISREFKFSVR